MKNRKNLLKKFVVMAVTVLMMSLTAMPAMASDVDGSTVESTVSADEVLKPINNLNELLYGIARGLGIATAIFGGIMLGMSFSSQDTSQRITGVGCMVGGCIMIFLKWIINFIAG